MAAEPIGARVAAILYQQLDIEFGQVTREAALTGDLAADDLDRVCILLAVEEKFDIEISDDAFEGVRTVGDLVALVERLTP